MAKINNKGPKHNQPGEKQPGTFHFNPGNMSGKKAVRKDEAEQQSNGDRIQDRHHRQEHKP
jgi:hypothetical protein